MEKKRRKVLRLVPILCFQASGDEILAFYAPEGLWHPAVVGGVFPAKLNEKGDPECYYYAVTYPVRVQINPTCAHSFCR